MRYIFEKYYKESFWKWKNQGVLWRFRLRKLRYSVLKQHKDQSDKRNSFFAHLKLTLLNIIKAFSFIMFLYFLEGYATSIWNNYLNYIPDWIVDIKDILPKPTYPNDRDPVIQLLTIIASVTGVILALFYPVLATIASTAYAKVHANVRNLLLSEKETQGYLRRLTYLTAFALIVLLFTSFGYNPGNLIITYLLFYCLIVLFGILKIGLGVYNLLEPASLITLINDKLTTSINEVTSKAPYYHDPAFQKFYRQEASKQISNLELITNLSDSRGVQDFSFLKCNQYSFEVLNYYLRIKASIPRNSEWFPLLNIHKSYFESDMTERGLSKNTSTYIRPSQEKNNLWFEEMVIETTTNAVDKVVSSGRYDLLAQSMTHSKGTIEILGHQFNTDVAEKLLTSFRQNLESLTKEIKAKDKLSDYSDWRAELESIEVFAYSVFAFQYGFLQSIENFNAAKFNVEYMKINWQEGSSIYKTTFNSELYSTLDRFVENHLNEIEVEGKRVTPDWYYMQSLCAEYLISISKKLPATIEFTNKYLVEITKELDRNGMSLVASFSSHIGLEVVRKLRFRLNEVRETLKTLDVFEKSKGEFNWSTPDYKKLEKSLLNYEKDFFEITHKNIFPISKLIWSNKFPDIFAHSYSIVSRYLNRCFEENDKQLFIEVFPLFLSAAIKAFENNNRNFKHYNMPENISYQSLVDLMEISGYAYLYSEIHNDRKYWEVTKESWNIGFTASEQNIMILVAYYRHYKSYLHGTGINFTEHSEREKTYRELAKHIDRNTIADPLVKMFIPDRSFGSLYYNTAELFLEMYIFTFIEAKQAVDLMPRREVFNGIQRSIDNDL